LRAPGLSPFAYWAVVAVLLIVAGLVTWLVVRLVRSHDASDDPRRRARLATTAQVRKVASGQTLRHRAATLRPALHHPSPAEVRYLLDRSEGSTGVGVGGGLNAVNRAAPLRQGPPCGHQRHLGRARRGRDDLEPGQLS
jgi:hypothetical protein